MSYLALICCGAMWRDVIVGKSSFLLALLRLNLVTEGDMLLDGSSLLAMSLEDARDAIAL